MSRQDPAYDQGDHICAELGELQPECDGYYCAQERDRLALRAGETALSPEDQLQADASRIVEFELNENADWWRARRAVRQHREDARR